MNYDRTVHATRADGAEVARYDRAGKYYLEHPDGRRYPLTLETATSIAADPTSRWHERKPGGMRFDAVVRDKIAARKNASPS